MDKFDSLFNLAEKIAIVTGASSGLGERFVRVLHAVNASVVCCARRLDRLQQLQKELIQILHVVNSNLYFSLGLANLKHALAAKAPS